MSYHGSHLSMLCINPNALQSPTMFDKSYVERQLEVWQVDGYIGNPSRSLDSQKASNSFDSRATHPKSFPSAAKPIQDPSVGEEVEKKLATLSCILRCQQRDSMALCQEEQELEAECAQLGVLCALLGIDAYSARSEHL